MNAPFYNRRYGIFNGGGGAGNHENGVAREERTMQYTVDETSTYSEDICGGGVIEQVILSGGGMADRMAKRMENGPIMITKCESPNFPPTPAKANISSKDPIATETSAANTTTPHFSFVPDVQRFYASMMKIGSRKKRQKNRKQRTSPDMPTIPAAGYASGLNDKIPPYQHIIFIDERDAPSDNRASRRQGQNDDEIREDMMRLPRISEKLDLSLSDSSRTNTSAKLREGIRQQKLSQHRLELQQKQLQMTTASEKEEQVLTDQGWRGSHVTFIYDPNEIKDGMMMNNRTMIARGAGGGYQDHDAAFLATQTTETSSLIYSDMSLRAESFEPKSGLKYLSTMKMPRNSSNVTSTKPITNQLETVAEAAKRHLNACSIPIEDSQPAENEMDSMKQQQEHERADLAFTPKQENSPNRDADSPTFLNDTLYTLESFLPQCCSTIFEPTLKQSAKTVPAASTTNNRPNSQFSNAYSPNNKGGITVSDERKGHPFKPAVVTIPAKTNSNISVESPRLQQSKMKAQQQSTATQIDSPITKKLTKSWSPKGKSERGGSNNPKNAGRSSSPPNQRNATNDNRNPVNNVDTSTMDSKKASTFVKQPQSEKGKEILAKPTIFGRKRSFLQKRTVTNKTLQEADNIEIDQDGKPVSSTAPNDKEAISPIIVDDALHNSDSRAGDVVTTENCETKQRIEEPDTNHIVPILEAPVSEKVGNDNVNNPSDSNRASMFFAKMLSEAHKLEGTISTTLMSPRGPEMVQVNNTNEANPSIESRDVNPSTTVCGEEVNDVLHATAPEASINVKRTSSDQHPIVETVSEEQQYEQQTEEKEKECHSKGNPFLEDKSASSDIRTSKTKADDDRIIDCSYDHSTNLSREESRHSNEEENKRSSSVGTSKSKKISLLNDRLSNFKFLEQSLESKLHRNSMRIVEPAPPCRPDEKDDASTTKSLENGSVKSRKTQNQKDDVNTDDKSVNASTKSSSTVVSEAKSYRSRFSIVSRKSSSSTQHIQAQPQRQQQEEVVLEGNVMNQPTQTSVHGGSSTKSNASKTGHVNERLRSKSSDSSRHRSFSDRISIASSRRLSQHVSGDDTTSLNETSKHSAIPRSDSVHSQRSRIDSSVSRHESSKGKKSISSLFEEPTRKEDIPVSVCANDEYCRDEQHSTANTSRNSSANHSSNRDKRSLHGFLKESLKSKLMSRLDELNNDNRASSVNRVRETSIDKNLIYRDARETNLAGIRGNDQFVAASVFQLNNEGGRSMQGAPSTTSLSNKSLSERRNRLDSESDSGSRNSQPRENAAGNQLRLSREGVSRRPSRESNAASGENNSNESIAHSRKSMASERDAATRKSLSSASMKASHMESSSIVDENGGFDISSHSQSGSRRSQRFNDTNKMAQPELQPNDDWESTGSNRFSSNSSRRYFAERSQSSSRSNQQKHHAYVPIRSRSKSTSRSHDSRRKDESSRNLNEVGEISHEKSTASSKSRETKNDITDPYFSATFFMNADDYDGSTLTSRGQDSRFTRPSRGAKDVSTLTMNISSVGDPWEEITGASRIIVDAINGIETVRSEDTDYESTADQVEQALEILETYASSLGIKERELLLLAINNERKDGTASYDAREAFASDLLDYIRQHTDARELQFQITDSSDSSVQ